MNNTLLRWLLGVIIVAHRGAYQTGVADIQCMYAPEFNSHSESFPLAVK